jgi:hypothetical protein
MSTRAIFPNATSSSTKRLASRTMNAFGIRAILPRLQGRGLSRAMIIRGIIWMTVRYRTD